jgi:general secretion pathway protein F
MLRRAASIYETALIRQIERVTALVTPVTTVVIGAVVGGLILTVMSAIVSINDLALQ